MISELLKEKTPNPIQLVVGLDDLKALLAEVVNEANRRAEIIDRVENGPVDPAEEKYLNMEATLTLLHISKSTLWRWTKMGILKKYKMGGKPVYKCSELSKLLNENGTLIF